MQPTGLLPVWSRGCSRRFVLGRARRPGIKGYRYHSTHAGNFNQDLSGRCQLGFYQYGSDFGAKGRTNSHQFSLCFRLGRDQRTTPGRRRQPKFLAVATLRISRGHQYRRLLLTDRSKPVSARRGLPTLRRQLTMRPRLKANGNKELTAAGALVITWLPQLLL